ncbi:MAG: hypothetical protein GWP47_02610, partial [Actinobacteria bacterium]|nr:hypothetical protein [Actinomycetota bacterium]
ELHNLAADPGYLSVATELRTLTADRWDIEVLNSEVHASQRRRQFLRSVAAMSGAADWSHVPPDQASQHVLRDKDTYNDWAYGSSLQNGT